MTSDTNCVAEFDPEEEYPDQNSDGELGSDDEGVRARDHYISVGCVAVNSALDFNSLIE